MSATPQEVASETFCAFHSTERENIPSIRENGIHADLIADDSEMIVDILEELGYDDPFPFDRREVNYAHIDPERVSKRLQRQREEERTGRSSKYVFFAIDMSRVDCPIYLANMSIITDLIDYDVGGARHMMYSDCPEESVEKYRDSISQVRTQEDIEQYDFPDNGCIEMVIDGDISPEALITVLD